MRAPLASLVRRPLLAAALLASSAPSAAAQTAPAPGAPVRHASPDSVRIVTEDIPRFWRAYDLAMGKDSAERVRIFEEVYLRPASPGLRDMMRLRLMEWSAVRPRLAAVGWSADTVEAWRRRDRGTPERDSLERALEPLLPRAAAENLVQALAMAPRWYAGIRARTLAVDTATVVTDEIRRGLRRLAELYPEARFPDVYFIIGNMSTGGTVGPHGMLIGTEQYGGGPDTPRDELPSFFAEILATHTFDRLPGLVLHEAVHTLQPARGPSTLLAAALHEGIADYVSELAAGPWHAGTPRQRYGRAHEREVWLDFADEMATDSTIRTWMYNGNVPKGKNHGALDIGYWVGYAIAKAYHERAADRRAALRELILLPDPERVLRESGYAERFGEAAGRDAGATLKNR
jgi:hypothetical protein